MRYFALIYCLALFVVFSQAHGQTTLNPDISAVGDFQVYSHNDESRADESEKFNMTDPGIELNIGGYLNPYSRADIVIAWHGDHNAEVEEAYASFVRGLPLNMNIRAGKYLLEFGRLNPVHEHAWSFIQRPLPHVLFFGEEGLSDVAVRSSILLPTGGAYTEFMVGILKGEALQGHHHEDEVEDAHDEPGRVDPGFFTRLTTSLAVGEYSELALGISGLNSFYTYAEHDEEEAKAVLEENHDQLRAWVLGFDAKYKYKPNRNTALLLEGELLTRIDEQADNADNLTSLGGYGYIDYRFRQRYNIGGIFEYCDLKELHHDAGEFVERENTVWRAGAFIGFAPVEETSVIRLVGHWTEPEEGDGFWELTMQLVISLGPHQPHNF